MLNNYIRATVVKPVINEKSMKLTEGGKYSFHVDTNVNKDQVWQFVEKKFGVDVLSVGMVTIPAKRRMQRNRRGYFSAGGYKKAIVTVKKGQKIALFEMAQAEDSHAGHDHGEGVEVRTAEGETAVKTKEKKSLLRGTKVKVEKTNTAEDRKGEEVKAEK